MGIFSRVDLRQILIAHVSAFRLSALTKIPVESTGFDTIVGNYTLSGCQMGLKGLQSIRARSPQEVWESPPYPGGSGGWAWPNLSWKIRSEGCGR